jgi:hypothetical protein
MSDHSAEIGLGGKRLLMQYSVQKGKELLYEMAARQILGNVCNAIKGKRN